VTMFATWRRGRALLHGTLAAEAMDVNTFLKSTAKVIRVPATAIYLTANKEGIPAALLHNLKNNLVLHERTILLTVETALTPHVPVLGRLQIEPIGQGFSRVTVRYGFAESPDIPAALADADLDFDPKAAAYFLSRQTLVPSRKPGMPFWQDHLFAAMVRNSETSMSFFKLPTNRG
jgi:KUP system potassium uptake protein